MKNSSSITQNGFQVEPLCTNQKASEYAKINYYQSKIRWLQGKHHPRELLVLTCRDAPISTGDLTSNYQRRLFIKKCLRYYSRKINELTRNKNKHWWNCWYS